MLLLNSHFHFHFRGFPWCSKILQRLWRSREEDLGLDRVRIKKALILMIKVVRVDKGQEEDLNLALILVIRPFEPAGPFDRARVREGEDPHSLRDRGYEGLRSQKTQCKGMGVMTMRVMQKKSQPDGDGGGSWRDAVRVSLVARRCKLVLTEAGPEISSSLPVPSLIVL